MRDGSACETGTQYRVPSIRGFGSGLVSQVSNLGDALGVVGIFKKLLYYCRLTLDADLHGFNIETVLLGCTFLSPYYELVNTAASPAKPI